MIKPLTGTQLQTIKVSATSSRTVNVGKSAFLMVKKMPGEMKMEMPGTAGFLIHAGFEFRPDPGETFDQFTLFNETESDVDVVMYVGSGNVFDHSLRIVDQGEGLKIKSPDGLGTIATVDVGTDATLLVPANSATRYVYIYNPDDTQTLWVGDADLDVGRGIPIPPETGKKLESADNIYGIVETDTIDDVAVTRFFFR